MKDGLIEKSRIYSDCLYPDFITELNEKLKGSQYDSEGIMELKERLKTEFKENENWVKMSEDLCEWVKSEL